MAARWSRGRVIAAALVLAATVGTGGIVASPPVRLLRDLALSQRIDGELKPEEIHRYRVSLTAGRSVLAVADQTGVDVLIVLRGPAGAELARADARSSGQEPLSAAVSATGVHEILVSAASPRAATG